jgi:cytochrome P450
VKTRGWDRRSAGCQRRNSDLPFAKPAQGRVDRFAAAAYTHEVSTLPPGPRSILRTTLDVARKPYEAMSRLRERYGDPFSVNAINGKLIVTAEPERIREVFSNKDPDLFEPFASAALTPFFGRNSLLLMQGEPHRRERKLLTPPFHGERMRTYGEIMASAARSAAQAMTPGQPFTAIDLGQRISLEVIIRAVFGVDDPARLGEYADLLKGTLEAALPIFMFAKAFQKAPFGLGPWARYQRVSAQVDELLYRQIAQIRPHAEGREDILSLMLMARYEDGSPMADEHVRDELRTLLIAGHETSAITLAWALERVHRDPAVLERLLAEIDGSDGSAEALAKLPYLGAVIDETLRQRPVIEVVFRKLTKPWRFAGYDLEAGMTIAPALELVHMREDLYPEPTRFRPERMLERKPGPFEFMPFGGGNRRCIGAAFATHQVRIALGTVLREWSLELREPGPVAIVRRSVSLGPENGVRMAMLGSRTRLAVDGSRSARAESGPIAST